MNNEDVVNRLQRIEDKQDKAQEMQTEMLVVLTKNTFDISRNTEDVAHHIARSDKTDSVIEIMDARLKKVEETDNKLKWTISTIVALAAIATFLKEMGFI